MLADVIRVILGHLGQKIGQLLELPAVHIALPSAALNAVGFLPNEVGFEIIYD